MKTIKTLIFSALLLSATPFVAQNRSIEFNHAKWQEIVEKAKTENKLIFVDAYASWCGPCKWMAANSFTKDEVADFYNDTFVNAKIDMEKEEGPELQKTFQVRAFPTLIFIDPNTGKMVHRSVGGKEPAELIALGKLAIDPENRLSGYEKRYAEGKLDQKGVLAYIEMLSEAYLPADQVVEDYFKKMNPADVATKANWDILSNMASVDNKPFALMLQYQKQFATALGADMVNEQIGNVYFNGASPYFRKNDMKGLEEYKAKISKSGYTHANQLFLSLELQKYGTAKNWDEFVKTGDKLIADKTYRNVNQLSSISSVLINNSTLKAHQEKALAWAKRSVELKKNTRTMDNYAKILMKVGKKDEAIAATLETIELAKKEGIATENFENRLKELKGESTSKPANSVPMQLIK